MKKHRPQQEKKMPTPEQIEAHLENAKIKILAEAEEREQANKIAAARQAAEEAETAEEEPIASVAAKGREHLMAKLREHAEKIKPEYVPPAMTERMRANIDAELEAGRRAVARHAAQAASRPVPVKEKWDGDNTKVFRPGTVVPDPKASGSNQFNGVPATFDPNA